MQAPSVLLLLLVGLALSLWCGGADASVNDGLSLLTSLSCPNAQWVNSAGDTYGCANLGRGTTCSGTAGWRGPRNSAGGTMTYDHTITGAAADGFRFWGRRNHAGDNDDAGDVGIDLLDENNTVIASATNVFSPITRAWYDFTVSVTGDATVMGLAKVARVWFRCTRTGGSNCDTHLDTLRFNAIYVGRNAEGAPFSCAQLGITCDGGTETPNGMDGGATVACGCPTTDHTCDATCVGTCTCNAVSCTARCGSVMNQCQTVTCNDCMGDEDCTATNCVCKTSAQTCGTGTLTTECGSISIQCRSPTTRECGSPCNGDQACTSNICTCDEARCDAGEDCGGATGTCDCTAAAQACDTSPTNYQCGTHPTQCTNPANKNCGNCLHSDQKCDTGICKCDATKCLGDEVCNSPTQRCVCARTCATAPFNNRECGTINGVQCNGATTLDCTGQTCNPDEFCSNNKCACTPMLAAQCAGDKCGVLTNRCSNSIDCDVVNNNPCTAHQECQGNACVCTANSCKAAEDRTCSPNGNQTCLCDPVDPQLCTNKCGKITNRCGRELDCGACLTKDEQCVNNICVCDKLTCGQTGCGVLSNLCSTLPCPGCVGEDSCIDNACQCVTRNCSTLGKECGTHRSCFDQVVCGTATGTCANGWPCSAEGNCINPNCVPKTTCVAQGMECGKLDTGCVNATCGICPTSKICDSSFKCVCPPIDPTFCATNKFECDDVSDGCNTFSCGTCTVAGYECYQNTCWNASLIPKTTPSPEKAASSSAEDDAGADSLLWVFIAAPALCVLLLVGAGVFFLLRRRKDDDKSDDVQMDSRDDQGDTLIYADVTQLKEGGADNEDVVVYDNVGDVEDNGDPESGTVTPVVYDSLQNFRDENPEEYYDDDDGEEDAGVYTELAQFQTDSP
jgi:hypothetical protein